MRKKIVAGNWKMNLSKSDATTLSKSVDHHPIHQDKVEVVLFAPLVYLDSLNALNLTNTKVGAQNFYPEKSGAYTGEVSVAHLEDLNVKTVLIGHSERRTIFGEDNALLKRKVDAALNQDFRLFFCCGEPENVRENQKQNEYVAQQLEESLFHIDENALSHVVIAYEPIWAIGTGKTASKEQANEMHQFIRQTVEARYGKNAAQNIQILYGGSCNAKNAHDLFSMSDIDGGLIGGASLIADDFIQIVNAAQ